MLTVEIEDFNPFELRNLTSRINQLPNKIYSEKINFDPNQGHILKLWLVLKKS